MMRISLTLALALVAVPRLATANEKTVPPSAPPPTDASTSPRRSPAPRVPAPHSEAVTSEPEPPPPVDTRWYLDAMLGIGSEHLNLGIGARGGKTFENHFYVGGLLVYHLGTSSSATVGTMTVTSSASGFYLGPERGYEIPLAPKRPVVVRPYLGLGLAQASVSSSAGTSGSSSELSMWPGVAAHYQLSDSSYFIGGDLRIVTGPWGTSFGLFVLGGTHVGS